MKKITLVIVVSISLVLFSSQSIHAQKIRKADLGAPPELSKPDFNSMSKNFYGDYYSSNVLSGNKNIDLYQIGKSGNIYSGLVERQVVLAYDEDADLYMYTHRADPLTYPEALNSGAIICNVSDDGGETWTDHMVVNEDDYSMRYPSGVVFNPNDYSDVEDVFTMVCGPAHVSGVWSYSYFASAFLDEELNDLDLQLISVSSDYTNGELIRNGLSVTDAGMAHVSGYMYNMSGSYANDWVMVIANGTFDETSNVFDWEYVTIEPDLSERDDGTVRNRWLVSTAWNNSGTVGYLFTSGNLDDMLGNGAYQPIVYKSDDSGDTWDLIDIELADNPIFEIYLQPATDGSHWPTTLNNMDGVVDMNDNLQLFARCQASYSTHEDSLDWTYTNDHGKIFNIEISEEGVENIIYIDSLHAHDVAAFSTYSYAQEVGWNCRLQASRTVDGSACFAIWCDTEDPEDYEEENAKPDIMGWGRSIEANSFEGPTNFTQNEDNQGEYWFHYTSPIAKTTETETGIEYSIGVSKTVSALEMSLNTNLDVVTHYFVDGITFSFEEDEIELNEIGKSANIYTALVEYQKAMAYDQDANAYMMTHRADPATYPDAENSGAVICSVSEDNGVTWDYHMVVNDDENMTRYPSGALFNPNDYQSIEDVYTVVCGPSHTGGIWDNSYYASTLLDGELTNLDIQFIATTSDYTNTEFMRSGLSVTDNGMAHVAGYMYNASASYATEWVMVVANGTFNETSNIFDWEYVTIEPEFSERDDGTIRCLWLISMAWDNNGICGYVFTSGNLEGVEGDGGYQPIVYRSEDSGETWDLIDIELADHPTFEEHLAPTSEGNYWPNIFNNLDGIVDINGNLQLFANCQAATSTDTDLMEYFYNDDYGKIFNIEINEYGVKDVIYVDSLHTQAVDVDSDYAYSTSADKIGWDCRLQASRSVGGSTYFAIWGDTEVPEDDTEVNSEPDLLGWGKSILTDNEEGPYNFTGDGDDPGRYWFHYVSPVAKKEVNEIGIDYSIGVSTTVTPIEMILNTDLDQVTHSFVDGISFSFGNDTAYIEVDPSTMDVDDISGGFDVEVTSNVEWMISEDCDWVSCDTLQGDSNGSFTIDYEDNYNNLPRTCHIIVYNPIAALMDTVALNQEPAEDNLLIDSTSFDVDYLGGMVEVNIQTNIDWEITEPCEWLYCDPESGFEDGSFEIFYEENPLTTPRTCTIEVGDGYTYEEVTIEQGEAPYIEATPTEQEESSSSGYYEVIVESNIDWTVSEGCDWLYCSPDSGSENGSFLVYYEANPDLLIRVCEIIILGDNTSDTISILQAAIDYIDIEITETETDYMSGSVELYIYSNVDWVASEDCDWLYCDPESGSNDATIEIYFEDNLNYDSRSCYIDISNGELVETIEFVQFGEPAITILPTELLVPYNSGSTIISVFSNTNWTVGEECDWLYCDPTEGSLDGTFSIYFEENLLNTFRTCTIPVTINNSSAALVVSQEFYTGIEKPIEDNWVQLFPNPVSQGVFYIEVDDDIVTEGYDLKVFSLTGEKIVSKTGIKEQQIKLDGSTYNPGVYFVCLYSENLMVMKKVVFH